MLPDILTFAEEWVGVRRSNLYPRAQKALVMGAQSLSPWFIVRGKLGSGKSLVARILFLYRLAGLLEQGCPQEAFGMSRGSTLVMVVDDLTCFRQIQADITQSPFFRYYAPRSSPGEIPFARGVSVILAQRTVEILGLNIFGAYIEQGNGDFLVALNRRIKSRFFGFCRGGALPTPGIIMTKLTGR
jgi:hypothetical protein